MSVLEDVLRRSLARYDPPQPPAATAYRPLTSHEGKLPAWLPEPYGPDVTVWGPRREALGADEGGLIYRYCREHDVEWTGYALPCWCCEAGIPEVTA